MSADSALRGTRWPHRDGLVDADYVTRSGDHRYAVGQRLVVSASDVRRLADIAEKLAAGIEMHLPTSVP